MAYRRRGESEADLYHVFARGTGRRIIFEDDSDRAEYLRRMGAILPEIPGSLHAWCLMGNHVHFVVRMRMDALSMFVKRLNGGYARFFNGRHGRSGHLFESRFGSEPIKSEAQLMAAVRYVHRNPVKPGLSITCDYPWSSFREYTGLPFLTDTLPVLELFGGLAAFLEFHQADAEDGFMDDVAGSAGGGAVPIPRRMTDDEAVSVAKSLVGEAVFEGITALPRAQRDACLATLRDGGLSIRQIELVTGINRNSIWAAGN